MKTCEENDHRSPENWQLAKKVVEHVGLHGMSGEETDEDPGTTPRKREKRFLVRPVKWMNPELQRLFKTIDTYENAIDREGFSSSSRGPVPYVRVSTTCYRPVPRLVKIAEMPRNYYDDTWYQGKNDGEQKSLKAHQDSTIPSLVSAIDNQLPVLRDLIYLTFRQDPYTTPSATAP